MGARDRDVERQGVADSRVCACKEMAMVSPAEGCQAGLQA